VNDDHASNPVFRATALRDHLARSGATAMEELRPGWLLGALWFVALAVVVLAAVVVH
jgi:hypothetical protein